MLPVNLPAVLVAALAAFFVGFLWHGPLLGKVWMKLSGMRKEDVTPEQMKNMWKFMLMALVQQLVTAFVLAELSALTGAADVSAAAMIAFWAWLGFIVT